MKFQINKGSEKTQSSTNHYLSTIFSHIYIYISGWKSRFDGLNPPGNKTKTTNHPSTPVPEALPGAALVYWSSSMKHVMWVAHCHVYHPWLPGNGLYIYIPLLYIYGDLFFWGGWFRKVFYIYIYHLYISPIYHLSILVLPIEQICVFPPSLRPKRWTLEREEVLRSAEDARRIFLIHGFYNVGPTGDVNVGLYVYKPHENYSYKYNKP